MTKETIPGPGRSSHPSEPQCVLLSTDPSQLKWPGPSHPCHAFAHIESNTPGQAVESCQVGLRRNAQCVFGNGSLEEHQEQPLYLRSDDQY